MIRIDPRIPMSVEDFAAIYAANPDAAASRVHMDFPTEAKSYMRDQWKALGMQGFPEEYFRRARATAAVTPPQTTVAPPAGSPVPGSQAVTDLSTQWPTFRNELERNIALDMGAYNPVYANPLSQTAAVVAESRRRQDMRQRSNYERSQFPLGQALATQNPEEIVAAQLAGDTYGDTKRVLQSLQGIDPETYLNAPPDQRPVLAPYRPTQSLDPARIDGLDMDLMYDPEFAKLLGRDPERAAFVYRSLTGRDLAGAIERTTKERASREDTWTKFVTSQLQQGARVDPVTGKWKVWNTTEQADPITREIKAVRALADATPEQQEAFQQFYSRSTGFGLPRPRPADASSLEHVRATRSRLTPQQAAFADEKIAKAQAELGHALTPRQELAIIANAVRAYPTETSGTFLGVPTYPILSGLDAFGNFLINDVRATGQRIRNDVNFISGLFGSAPQPLSVSLTPEEEAAMLAANPNLE